ncbi:MAG: glycoside hydrolase family 16 protein [Gammaproteobacteria bacterium]|nr:glycoside hydrolase family 16 protein [Gammaproteobacteria bacterium]
MKHLRILVMAISPALPAAALADDANAALAHTFPLLVDGDGWSTRLFATNVSDAPSRCNLSLRGGGLDGRFAGGSPEFTLAAEGGLSSFASAGTGALAFGSAQLECSQPVVAQGVISLTSGGQTVGMSPVTPAQAGVGFQFPLLGAGGPVAVVVGNESESPADCRLAFADAGGATIDAVDYTVPAAGLDLKFLADALALPADLDGAAARVDCDRLVTAVSLQFSGAAFAALPPAVLNAGPTEVIGEAARNNINIGNPALTIADNTPVAPGGGMRLVWSDEFDAARLDPATWFFETGDGSEYGIPGWGNDELQWYLPNSASIENGNLVITARRQAQNGFQYTSARINTRGRFALRYGRIEARIRLPAGPGLWPAFWLLPQEDAYGGWAASGEIDIMEAVNLGGSGGNTVHGTLHYGGAWPNNRSSANRHAVGGDITENFHVYALEWDEREMRWYVDDTLYATESEWSTTAASFPAPFDRPFYIILNLAVGGGFPGPPNAATNFPAALEVDYVRVYSGEP